MEVYFFITLAFLLYLSYYDIKHHKVKNSDIIALLFYGAVVTIFTKNILSIGLGMALTTILSVVLWKFKVMGAGDSKLLITLVPLLPYDGIANVLIGLWFSLCLLLFIGTLYIYGFKILLYAKKRVPFIPCITIVYLISWIFRFG